jgi:hypothetical protein
MDFMRQKGILDPEEIVFPVTVIGAGGIGSFVAPILAKMGVSKIAIYDPDKVEDHNLPNQMFRMSDIGRSKVEALRDIVLDMTGVKMETHDEFFPNGDKLKGIVVSGVDSMASRQKIWEEIISNNDIKLYVDARLGGEVVEVLTVRPSFRLDRKFYKSYLFPDSEAAVLPCTARNIVYNGSVVAGLVASQIKKWIREEGFPRRVSFCLKTFELVEME